MQKTSSSSSWLKPASHPGIIGSVNLLASGLVFTTVSAASLILLIGGFWSLTALGLGVILLVAWFYVQRLINSIERHRAEAIYEFGYPAPQVPAREPGFTGWVKWLGKTISTTGFWRGTAHHFIKSFLGAFLAVILLVVAAVAAFLLSTSISPLVAEFFRFQLPSRTLGMGLGTLLVLFGVAAFWYAAMLDYFIDSWLLAPSTTTMLFEEVSALDDARRGAVGAAEAERARLERDLHDGIQPMLVAQSMKIGMARAKLDTDPDEAAELLAEAHEDSKQAVAELRRFVRGLQPAVLGDRGLDAALSGLAAQSVVPVQLNVNLPRRVDHDVESVAYFVVAEVLTNINKHANATQAVVNVSMTPQQDYLLVSITDNGQGGAYLPTDGVSGLTGLRDRVRAARGSWELISPAGGPTELKVELPCAS